MKTLASFAFLFIVGCMLFTGGNVHAGSPPLEKTKMEFDYDNVVQTEEPAAVSEGEMELIRNNLKYVLITGCLYAFSLVIITILMKMTPSHLARDIVNAVGLVSVIFASIILVLVVDTSDALTAPMGILGAIAGYLFGTSQQRHAQQDNSAQPPANASG